MLVSGRVYLKKTDLPIHDVHPFGLVNSDRDDVTNKGNTVSNMAMRVENATHGPVTTQW